MRTSMVSKGLFYQQSSLHMKGKSMGEEISNLGMQSGFDHPTGSTASYTVAVIVSIGPVKRGMTWISGVDDAGA